MHGHTLIYLKREVDGRTFNMEQWVGAMEWCHISMWKRGEGFN
jgi:hypothetical protein